MAALGGSAHANAPGPGYVDFGPGYVDFGLEGAGFGFGGAGFGGASS
ncbi:hypothetical protein FrEUN1fDRAFT_3819 [Parafrankia sp. EUN1f]|nr:hypothetical protein FrEUN1fDRAFT_3819 [Parafrankia sp. EUN1f]